MGIELNYYLKKRTICVKYVIQINKLLKYNLNYRRNYLTIIINLSTSILGLQNHIELLITKPIFQNIIGKRNPTNL